MWATFSQTKHALAMVLNQGFMHDKNIASQSVTHVLVDTWMLTVKPVYKLLNVSEDLKWTTKITHVTPFSLTFKS